MLNATLSVIFKHCARENLILRFRKLTLWRCQCNFYLYVWIYVNSTSKLASMASFKTPWTAKCPYTLWRIVHMIHLRNVYKCYVWVHIQENLGQHLVTRNFSMICLFVFLISALCLYLKPDTLIKYVLFFRTHQNTLYVLWLMPPRLVLKEDIKMDHKMIQPLNVFHFNKWNLSTTSK